MIYYSSTARETALSNISELIVKLASVPQSCITRSDVQSIMYYLDTLAHEVKREDRLEKMKRRCEQNDQY